MANVCRAWADSRDFTHGTLSPCGIICVSGFRCRPYITTCTCYNYPQSPPIENVHRRAAIRITNQHHSMPSAQLCRKMLTGIHWNYDVPTPAFDNCIKLAVALNR